MGTTQIVYVGPDAFGESIPGQMWGPAETICPLGVPTEVPDATAGRPPSGKSGDEKFDPGEGLLAVPERWAKPGTKAAKEAAARAQAVQDGLDDDHPLKIRPEPATAPAGPAEEA